MTKLILPASTVASIVVLPGIGVRAHRLTLTERSMRRLAPRPALAPVYTPVAYDAPEESESGRAWGVVSLLVVLVLAVCLAVRVAARV